jgi:single-stranded-DNA-specific exonuclease
LDPLGHGNPEPVFLARNLQLAAPVRLMKEKHIRLELHSAFDTKPSIASAPTKAIGWNMAKRAQELSLDQGSTIDLAYRIRENDHPQYGGLQIEIAGIQLAKVR